ncbi:MAG: hypothetical protein IKJ65_01960 [Clostridia bacterium]|nr:hypothetical protein [Clostridia bacterium]
MKAIVKGKTHDVKWMWLLERKDQLIFQIVDERPISEIAADWEGADVIERISEEEGNKTYEGYTRIARIYRKDDIKRGCMEIVLTKE